LCKPSPGNKKDGNKGFSPHLTASGVYGNIVRILIISTRVIILPKIRDELNNCTVFLLGKAYQKAHGEFRKILKPYGVTNFQHLVVEALVHAPGLTASELGELLILDKATLSGVIQRLQESSWIEKRADKDDARIQKLYPTEKAFSVVGNMVEDRNRFDTELLAGFTQEERILLKRLLRDLVW
jgi:DNA-binding MarR family transcriptional regulator